MSGIFPPRADYLECTIVARQVCHAHVMKNSPATWQLRRSQKTTMTARNTAAILPHSSNGGAGTGFRIRGRPHWIVSSST